MSRAVNALAPVTNPFAFTENFNGVIVGYGEAFTFCNNNVVVDSVKPDPTTSPTKVIDCGYITNASVVTLVTNPFEFTVTTGTT